MFMQDTKTGLSKRYGFVVMADEAGRDRVLAENRHRIEGQTVRRNGEGENLFVYQCLSSACLCTASLVPSPTSGRHFTMPPEWVWCICTLI